MASALTDKLSRLVKEMRGQARITDTNVQDMLREVRMALLEADVALPVVRDFIARVKDKALGAEVMGSLQPGQVLVSIVSKELAATMGEGVSDINLAAQPDALSAFAPDKGYFDVMFEASGSEKALLAGLDVVAPRGVIVTIGLGGDITLPMNTLVGKEIDLRGTFRFHPEFAVAMSFLNQGLIDGRPVISDIVAFDKATEAFQLAGDKRQSMKVQIAFGDESSGSQ